ncbi:MAG TPA: hypothetical protein VMQ83_13785 [Gammaproteobacteria bacterium]|nr:hypothetical protein [Gammaproteobacteria bacterium]
MATKIASTVRQHAPAAVIMLAAIVAAWFAYAPGLTGTMWFDDSVNLGGLSEVHETSNAFPFIFSGRAGPTGRPLALATFVPQAYAWPSALDVFLRTNILIHLLNGVLVTWFLYLLGLGRRQSEGHAALVGASSAAVWMLLPILASSSLLIVQRMTTLSAVFGLLGGIAYLYARRMIELRPVLALSGMTIALGVGALLGMLAKENGALLFLFILAIEATILDRPANISRVQWRSWFTAVLIVPAVIMLVYLVTRLPYDQSIVLVRNFNGLERLLTQASVLWNYLYLAFIPNLPGLGPFHDDTQVHRNILDLTAIVAVAGWIAVISAAVMLRRRAPLFTFAVAWYLLGHSLESTTIPLELYFEHRNYMPLIGPTYALIAATFAATLPWRRILMVTTAAYSLVLGGVLYSVTSLWGTPAIAVEMWYIYKPNSIRAAEVLAQQMEKVGSPDVARKVLMEVREKHPNAHLLDLQILLMSCQSEPDLDYSAAVRSLEERLRTADFSNTARGLLWGLDYLIRTGRCPQLPHNAVDRLTRSLLANPRFSAPDVRSNLLIILAQTAIERGETEVVVSYCRQALELTPSPPTLTAVIQVLDSAGLNEAAQDIIDEARSLIPSHPVKAKLWADTLKSLEQPK